MIGAQDKNRDLLIANTILILRKPEFNKLFFKVSDSIAEHRCSAQVCHRQQEHEERDVNANNHYGDHVERKVWHSREEDRRKKSKDVDPSDCCNQVVV